MANNAFETSDIVEMKGSVKGVTAISKKAKALLFLGTLSLMGFILFIIFSLDGSNASAEADRAKADKEQEQKKNDNEPATAAPILKGIGDGNAAVAATSVPSFDLKDPSAASATTAATTSAQAAGSTAGMTGAKASLVLPTEPVKPTVPALTPEQLELKNQLAQKEQLKKQALMAGMEIEGSAANSIKVGAAAGMPALPSSPFLAGASIPSVGAPTGHVGLKGMEQDDQNKQIRKESFLREAENKSAEFYLKEKKQAPHSPYELKMGWKIPAFLIDGLNSDLPGQTCAQVRENVFDSISGKYLLIPQGTKVCGTYDSQVAMGQERILMVWNRLIFEDGSSINLQGMPGTDQAGYAGFDADVDNHYVKLFGGALMMSLISAGVQLSQPQQSGNTAAPSASQVGAAALGQQLGQVGTALVQRDLKIQPTLKQKPGYRFNIQVTRDIVFPGPYKRSPT